MSTWAANQQQEAFYLWRRYLAMALHFRDGSSYDFGLYGGVTNATLQAFVKRPPDERAAFQKLKFRLTGINHDEFLFANFRKDSSQHYKKILGKNAFDAYNQWRTEYGSKVVYEQSVKDLLIKYSVPGRFQNLADAAIYLLNQNDSKVYEAVALMFQRNPAILAEVRAQAEENVMVKIHLDRVFKVQKLYSYLCII